MPLSVKWSTIMLMNFIWSLVNVRPAMNAENASLVAVWSRPTKERTNTNKDGRVSHSIAYS